MKKYNTILTIAVILLLNGCILPDQNTNPYNTVNKTPILKNRVIQTKRFYNTNKNELFNATVNLVQDESLTIINLNKENGIVSTDKITAVLSKREDDSFDVRISPTNTTNINPQYYQYIFDRLQKSLFLEQNLYNKNTSSNKVKPDNLNVIKNDKYYNYNLYKERLNKVKNAHREYSFKDKESAKSYRNLNLQPYRVSTPMINNQVTQSPEINKPNDKFNYYRTYKERYNMIKQMENPNLNSIPELNKQQKKPAKSNNRYLKIESD